MDCFSLLFSCPMFEATSSHSVNKTLGLHQQNANLHVHQICILTWNAIRRFALLNIGSLRRPVQFVQIHHIHGTISFNSATSLLNRSTFCLNSPITASFCRTLCAWLARSSSIVCRAISHHPSARFPYVDVTSSLKRATSLSHIWAPPGPVYWFCRMRSCI